MRNARRFYVYMLMNRRNTTIYVGITGNLEGRIWQHKNDLVEGFTKKYRLHKLVYYKEFAYSLNAIAREKQLKNWHREWKRNLIRSTNQNFDDLAAEWYVFRDAETSSA